MTFRIADSFTDALARLTAPEQKAAKTAAFDLQTAREAPGLQMHRVARARDAHFWTARAGRDLRLVLHKQDGDTLLAWVGHHDDAYAWAERRRLESHPRTGAMQIVEIRETVEDVVIQRYVEEAVRLPRLFAEEPDDVLLAWGVPQDWLEVVRAATEDTVLEIAAHLPAEAGEALLSAATGERPAVAATARGDPYAHPDAARRFRVMADEAELAAALEAPWERWAIWLHPAQREFVERRFNGPARVIGAAGTGKTVVALHRAVRLARAAPEARVLLTTFNETLAEGLRAKIALLAPEAGVRARITVRGIGRLARELHEAAFGPATQASATEVDAALAAAARETGTEVSLDFLREEWALIVDAWAVPDRESYRDLPRLGRRVRMAAGRRDALWQVFARARAQLAAAGRMTRARMLHGLAALYREGGARPFTHAVVDEAQDVSVAELHFLAALAGDRPDGLFFAGDIGQRIFRAPFPWKAAGVDIQGRSRSLKINYRTSQQIRATADHLLPPALVEADGGEDRRSGGLSLFEGPAPDLRAFATPAEEAQGAAAWLADLLSEGLRPGEVALLVRSDDELARAHEVARRAGARAGPLSGAGAGALAAGLMHDAKGAEFRAVMVLACDEDVIPRAARLVAARDARMIDEIMATERHLLYVAATRARERLWISGAGMLSEFLDDLR